jgi:hypothetical protein
MLLIGKDTDGIIDVSLENLKKIKAEGLELKEIRIYSPMKTTMGVVCEFEFEDNKVYEATGFSIGYGGRGPHGLHEAVRMFCPSCLSEDFWSTHIHQMDPKMNWHWVRGKGFGVML